MAYEVHHGDAIEWASNHLDHGAVVTSLPDVTNAIPGEGREDVDPWEFFRLCATAAFAARKPGTPAVFYQTDHRDNGTISKPEILFDVADVPDMRLLWHKIVLRQEPGTTDLHRPTYHHVLAFGDSEVGPGQRQPDVWRAGRRLYENATDFESADRMVRFALTHADTVVDPFCGQGTIPAMVDALGGHGIGIDADESQVEQARGLSLKPPEGGQ